MKNVFHLAHRLTLLSSTAFAVPDENFNLYFTQQDSEDLLRRVVDLAQGNGTEVLLSVGGWSGSEHFSQGVATAENRETFATNLANIVNEFGLDGIDLDWEYPGSPGATHDYAPDDSANLTLLLELLRQKLGDDKEITMAVSVRPFTGADGQPLTVRLSDTFRAFGMHADFRSASLNRMSLTKLNTWTTSSS